MADLLGSEPSLRVQLDRSIDQRTTCCGSNIATIHIGRGPHAAELKCSDCGVHRGWLPQEAHTFIQKTAERFGVPTEPIILRDTTVGDHVMEKKKYDNSGILFRASDDKQKETDRDYRGEITVNGVEYWLSAWIKQGKKVKFMSLAVKPKNAPPADKSNQLTEEMGDEIPF
jgi:hypothetical protein